MALRIQLRRDTAANWTSADPVLASGEAGFETDTGNLKIGDGSTAWTSLAYFAGAAPPAWDGDIADIDLDGGTDIGADLADADLILVDDGAGGTNRKSALSRVWTYILAKFAATPLPVTGGGTGGTDASTARTNLGLGASALSNQDVSTTDSPTFVGVTTTGGKIRTDDAEGVRVRNIADTGWNQIQAGTIVAQGGFIAQGLSGRWNDGGKFDFGTGCNLAWSSSATWGGTSNVNISYYGTGELAIGSGAVGSTAGSVRLTNLTASGTVEAAAVTVGGKRYSPYMGVYFSTPAATDMNPAGEAAGTYFKAAGTTTITNRSTDTMDDAGGTSNRMRYTGTSPRHMHIVAQATVGISSGTNQKIGIQVYHYDASAATGSLLAHSEAQTTIAGTNVEQITTHADVMMAENDYIEIWVANHTSNTIDPTLQLGYMFAVGMPG